MTSSTIIILKSEDGNKIYCESCKTWCEYYSCDEHDCDFECAECRQYLGSITDNIIYTEATPEFLK